MEFTAGEVYLVVACAFHPDAPAMRLNNSLGECQTQPRTTAFETCLAGGVFVEVAGMVEFAKNDITHIRVHAHACITDNDLDAAVRHFRIMRSVRRRSDDDLSSIGRKLNCIGQQMLEELFQQMGVCANHWQGWDANNQGLTAFHK